MLNDLERYQLGTINPRDRIGSVYGIYKVVDVLDEKDSSNQYIYKIVCQECGYTKNSYWSGFASPSRIVTNCTHLNVDGEYIKCVKWTNYRLQNIFNGMKRRCYSINDKDYNYYGARGIKICDEWLKDPALFESWALNNGYKDGLTIDRIDVNGNYEPNNCRWITAIDNARYKSTTILIDVDGESHTGREWADVLGLGTNRINTYIHKYGLANTVEFIKRYKQNPSRMPSNFQSYYDLYMNDNN